MVKIKSIKLDKKGISSILSPLECDVLRVLWEKNDSKVREIHKALRKRKNQPALTSVAVILDRLHQKNIVSRTIKSGRGGGHYIYTSMPKTEFEKSVIENIVDKLIDSFGEVAVNYFNKRFSRRK